ARTGTTWSTAASGLADGTWTVQATQSDTRGDLGVSAARTFTVDTVAPAVGVDQPADGATVTTATPALSGPAGNAQGDDQTVTIDLFAGASASGTPVQTIVLARQGGAWSTTAAALADGTYTVRPSQRAAAG